MTHEGYVRHGTGREKLDSKMLGTGYMATQTISDVFRHTNLSNESYTYLEQREKLRLAEIALMRQCEAVAEMRRNLPQGTSVQDYAFEEGPRDPGAGDAPVRTVHLTELFTGPGRALIVYQMMFGKRQKGPCPMCTAWIDCLNGIVRHIEQTADVVIVAAAGPEALRAHARSRGWDRLRLLSCGENTFKYDTGSEDREGNQDSTLSVFTRGADGAPLHFYTTHPGMGDGIEQRGLDLLNPIWNFLDLTPGGRGDFMAKLEYPKRG
jgi:predicted dithiol-disulfide oxidoreductase (DUF899 family)